MGAGAALAAPAQATLDDVVAAIGAGPKPSDFVIAVDTSGSMADHDRWTIVNDSLTAFAETLLPADHVCLLTFDKTATVRFDDVLGDDPSVLVASLPTKPAGAASDIGVGISAGLDLLASGGSNDVAAFVLVTDGEHRAAKGSPYSKPGSPAWQDLRSRATELQQGQSIAPYAVAPRPGADTQLLHTVFDNVTDVPASDITAQFSRLDADLVKVQAAELLRHDLGAGLSTDWTGDFSNLAASGGTQAGTIRVTSTMTHVPLVLNRPQVVGDRFAVTATGLPDAIELAPGESTEIPVQVSWTTAGQGYLQLQGELESPWQDVLRRDLGLDFAPAISGSTAFQTAPGLNLSAFLPYAIAALGMLAAAAAALFGYRVSRPELAGSLSFSTAAGRSDETVLSGRAVHSRPALGEAGPPVALQVSGARRRASGQREDGVSVRGRIGEQKVSTKLFDGDERDFGGVRVRYTSAHTRILSIIEN